MGSDGGGNIGSGWVSARLKDVCVAECGIQTGPFGSQLHQSDYVPCGTPIITVEHLGDNRIVHENVPLVSDHDRIRLERYSLRSGDIVFSRVGSVDRSALVRAAEDGWLFSGRCLRLRPNLNKINSEFLSYYFSQIWFKEHIRAIAVGATMPSINTQILSNVQISYPVDLAEQKRIAHILGTLDDKIELNRQMNKTLEEMARALFKSWFVDFDPVRAKMSGRWTRTTPLPGLPTSLFDLFPDHLVDSPLGEIPAGWRVGTLADIAELNPEVWSSATRPEFLRYVDLANTKWGRIESVAEYSSGDAPSRAQRVLRPGDTILGTVRPGNGSYALISDEGLTGSTGFAVLRPKNPSFTELVYLCATSAETIATLSDLADGGAYPAVRPDVVEEIPVVLASDSLISEFHSGVGRIMNRIGFADQESVRLTDVRDSCLAALI